MRTVVVRAHVRASYLKRLVIGTFEHIAVWSNDRRGYDFHLPVYKEGSA